MPKTFFSVEPKTLSSLTSAEGVTLLRDLLWAEARLLQLPPQNVIISLNDSVKDGGIDAKVEANPSAQGLLIKGNSFFQLKTGTTFKPWRTSDLKKELFGKSKAKPSRTLLGPAVASALSRNGRYVLVTLGHDLLVHQHTDSVSALRTLFQECEYQNPCVEVIGSGQIVGCLQRMPSLCLELTRRSNTPVYTVTMWSDRADMQLPLRLGAPQQQLIDQLRSYLRGAEFQHCRVIGEPGLGKTRLVLEAVLVPDLRASVLYVPTGEDLQASSFFHELLKSDRDYSVILVVDDCDERDRASIWAALKGRGQMQLVTIDHGPETSADSGMRVMPFPTLPDEQVQEILSDYTGQRHDLYKWAEWCSGSPRVAHAVGANLREHPDDILKPPATVDLWERFVIGHKRRDSVQTEQTFTVLRYLALFERFGFESPVQAEAQFICKLIHDADPSVTWAVFQRIVRRHRERRILQGRHTLFFVPKALHVYLWLNFWQSHGNGFEVDEFLERVPRGLLNGFMRLFMYAHASSVAAQAVQTLLCPVRGPYRNREFLVSEQGSHFLSVLAEAEPGGTVRLLESTIGGWRDEDLTAWQTGRQNIVWALEKIAVWQGFFTRATRLLVRLVRTESAANTNNLPRTLNTLFAIGPQWAPTQAAASERFPILEELVRGEDPSERTIGLALCGQWLSVQGPLRVIGVEFQGLRPTIEFWSPSTYGEWADELRRVWRFLHVVTQQWPREEKRQGQATLVKAAGGLIRNNLISNEVIDTLFQIADDPDIDKQALVELVVYSKRFRPQDLPKPSVDRLKRLDRKLTGTSFQDRFARYVLHSTWMEGHVVSERNDPRSITPDERIRRLASELSSRPKLLHDHVQTFVCSSAIRLFQFGYEVARQCTKQETDEAIVRAVESSAATANGQFLAGYFTGLRERDRKATEDLQLRILSNPLTRAIGVECAYRCGPTEPVLREMLKLYKSGQIASTAFSNLGITSRQIGLQKRHIDRVAQTLVARPDQISHAVCIELLNFYYLSDGNKARLPLEPTFSLLTSDKLFGPNDCSIGYHWHRVAVRFVEEHPEYELPLFSSIVDHRDTLAGTIRSSSYPNQLADDIARRHPKEVWSIIKTVLEREGRHSFFLIRWLGDNGFEDLPEYGAVRHLDPADVMNWIQEKPKERAPLAVAFLPKTLAPDRGGTLTRLFIDEFGDEGELAESLRARFWLGGWSGPESEYFSRLRDQVRVWLSERLSIRISNWLNRYLDSLSSMIEDARIREERER